MFSLKGGTLIIVSILLEIIQFIYREEGSKHILYTLYTIIHSHNYTNHMLLFTSKNLEVFCFQFPAQWGNMQHYIRCTLYNLYNTIWCTKHNSQLCFPTSGSLNDGGRRFALYTKYLIKYALLIVIISNIMFARYPLSYSLFRVIFCTFNTVCHGFVRQLLVFCNSRGKNKGAHTEKNFRVGLGPPRFFAVSLYIWIFYQFHFVGQ